MWVYNIINHYHKWNQYIINFQITMLFLKLTSRIGNSFVKHLVGSLCKRNWNYFKATLIVNSHWFNLTQWETIWRWFRHLQEDFFFIFFLTDVLCLISVVIKYEEWIIKSNLMEEQFRPVASVGESCRFKSVRPLGRVHVVPAWAPSGKSRFIPHFKDMNVK